jgi:hypothetical protein
VRLEAEGFDAVADGADLLFRRTGLHDYEHWGCNLLSVARLRQGFGGASE